MEQFGVSAEIRLEEWQGGPGTVLALEIGGGPVPVLFAAVGERGKPAERVADEAADEAIAYLQADPAPVDAHSGDQLLLPLALADGPSEFRVATVTRHLTTNLAVIQRFIDRSIIVNGSEGEPGVVQIDGPTGIDSDARSRV
jgi:RNA 3'-terminal phosphate cyclase (ATP)